MWSPPATIGFSSPAILFREILPNVVPVLIALLTLEMGIAVVVEAILSFVGLSVSSDTPTWGGMIAEGRQIVHEAWWVLAVPLVALFATVSLSISSAMAWPAASIRCCADERRRGLSIESLSAISLRDGGKPILRRVSLGVGTGEVHGLVGESGAGKSTIAQGYPRHHSIAGESDRRTNRV